MKITKHIHNAFKAIKLNKLRAGLSMLGIIIGVCSVIIMVAIGEGAQQDILEKVESAGTNILTITPGNSSNSDVRFMMKGGGGGSSDSDILNNDLIDELSKNIKNISYISPELSQNKQVIYKINNTNSTILGVNPEYINVRNSELEYGNFITQDNIDNMDKIAVLGQDAVSSLFDETDPIGKDVIIEGNIFTVVGIMEENSVTDRSILIPLSTAQIRIFGSKYYSTIALNIENIELIDETKSNIETLLKQLLNIYDDEDINFTISSQSDMVDMISEITGVFKTFLGGIAAISLLVGGIGVMNIMLVSVTERTREIGIRKAIGAYQKDILIQFLTEAITLSVLGGIIGIIISFITTKLLSNTMTTVITLDSVLMSFGFAFGIGVLFGMLPAYKASKLKPIDALRFE